MTAPICRLLMKYLTRYIAVSLQHESMTKRKSFFHNSITLSQYLKSMCWNVKGCGDENVVYNSRFLRILELMLARGQREIFTFYNV
jgi:hypothetical protein